MLSLILAGSVTSKPKLVLGGELSNSAATSVADIDNVMPKMKALGLNTVFVPAYWELLEPEENSFDFTLVDETISKARENNLKVIFLWFGAWKNSMSCYAPLWFKQDAKRFPRAMTGSGKPMEIATCFSENVLNADRKAFCKLMQHIKDVDGRQKTVIMMQVENEIGMIGAARDHCPLAEKVWQKEKAEYANGQTVFDEERFQAKHYARYVEQVAKAGKAIYDIPMFVNAALNSRGRKPGEYPSAGPLAHLMDIWKKNAPSIDIYAPDIYDAGFKGWVSQYTRSGNPFFTPETRLTVNSGVRALYCFGEAGAIGYSVFAIDQADSHTTAPLTKSYKMVNELSPLLERKDLKRWGLLFSKQDSDIERIIDDGDAVLTCRHYFTLPWDSRATDGSEWQEGGGIVLRLAKDEYVIAGSGLVVTFQTATEKEQSVPQVETGEDGFALKGDKGASKASSKKFYGKRMGIGFVDEVTVSSQGKLEYVRRENGDQDHQGRHARISCGDYKILHVKLYRY